jgi:hypothetical protein
MFAFDEIDNGAADCALAIGSLPPIAPLIPPCWAVAVEAESANIAAPANRILTIDVMNPSFASQKDGSAA